MSTRLDANGHMLGHRTGDTHTAHTARRTDTSRNAGRMGGVHLTRARQRSGEAESGRAGRTSAALPRVADWWETCTAGASR